MIEELFKNGMVLATTILVGLVGIFGPMLHGAKRRIQELEVAIKEAERVEKLWDICEKMSANAEQSLDKNAVIRVLGRIIRDMEGEYDREYVNIGIYIGTTKMVESNYYAVAISEICSVSIIYTAISERNKNTISENTNGNNNICLTYRFLSR